MGNAVIILRNLKYVFGEMGRNRTGTIICAIVRFLKIYCLHVIMTNCLQNR